jgi:hypothetical protein
MEQDVGYGLDSGGLRYDVMPGLCENKNKL